ncbi:MAG: GNAT family N-acetyltransferase [Xanthobacteraceae bacterium]|nr:GNAT family N-acetyltransferase [Xanthobacteraceae bacterium]
MRSSQKNKKTARLKVRAARGTDLQALIELEQRVFATDRLSRASLRRLLASKSALMIVAECHAGIAGAAVVLFRKHAAVARLYSIAVAPPMCGKGVAVALLVAAERAAKRRRCRCMRLEVHQSNSVAIARYRKSGYLKFGRHRKYYEDGGDALRFEKALT